MVSPAGSDLLLFCVVVQQGSMKDAAISVGVSPALVSKRIQRLEERLGVTLLERTRNGIFLTEPGKILMNHGHEVIDHMKRIEAEMSDLVTKPAGHIRATAPSALGTQIARHIVPAFAQQYPDITVQWDFKERYIDIIREEFDVAVRVATRINDPSLIAKPVMDIPLVLTAAPEYLKKHGAPESVDDLVHHNCLRLSPSGHLGWKFLDDIGEIKRVPVTGNFVSESDVALLTACVQGIGVLYAPQVLVQSDLTKGTLVELFPGQCLDRKLFIIHAKQKLTHKVRLFVDFLENTAQQINLSE